MAATVTANNTRVNASDSSTGWSNDGGGGPSPASEPQLRYQGTGAVNRKVTATSARQGVQYNAGSTIDMTAAANPLWIAKVKVADAGDLNATWGVELGIGSAAGARYEYNVAGSGANRDVFSVYNSQGGAAEGYVVVAINPTIAAWREATVGSPSLTAVDHYNASAQFVSGGAKSENLALDAIDVGSGLTYTGTGGTFQDGVDTDQGNTSNRWGYACAVGTALFLRGTHTLGTASSLVFDSTGEFVFFPDGYHGPGDFGIDVDLQNASTSVTLGGVHVGLGIITTSDTRPDFTVTGTSGTCLVPGQLLNFRNLSFTSACTVTGTIEAADIAQSGADLSGARIITLSASGVATINDATWTNLSGATFVQGGAGHAVEITTAGTYSLSGVAFSGYGADDTNSASIYNNSGGAVTINVLDGGDTPTIRNGSGSTTTVQNTVGVTITVVDSAGDPIEGARVLVEAAAGGSLTAGDDIVTGLTNASGVAENTGFNFSGNQPITGRVRKSTTSPLYKTANIIGTITSAGFSATIQMIDDE